MRERLFLLPVVVVVLVVVVIATVVVAIIVTVIGIDMKDKLCLGPFLKRVYDDLYFPHPLSLKPDASLEGERIPGYLSYICNYHFKEYSVTHV